jgi:hypothetical protein
MNRKNPEKPQSKRNKNKKLVGAWVEREIYDALKMRAQKDERGNSTMVVYRALTAYLAPELAEIEKSGQTSP